MLPAAQIATLVSSLLRHQSKSMKTLLATTNYAPGMASGAEANLSLAGVQQSLGDRVGDRVFSRLMEMVDFQQVSGDDYRGAGG